MKMPLLSTLPQELQKVPQNTVSSRHCISGTRVRVKGTGSFRMLVKWGMLLRPRLRTRNQTKRPISRAANLKALLIRHLLIYKNLKYMNVCQWLLTWRF